MAGKTKLYQRTGSPLIQGSSKRAVPFWKVWVQGGLYGLALGWVAMFVSSHTQRRKIGARIHGERRERGRGHR